MLTIELNPEFNGLAVADHCDRCGEEVCDGALYDGVAMFDDGRGYDQDDDGLEVLKYPDGSVAVAIADVGRRYCAGCFGKLLGNLSKTE